MINLFNHKKPKIYKKLLRLQDARQIQYNKWSKYFQIYSGSYLPYRPNELSKQGWTTKQTGKKSNMTEHTRKSTGQKVLRHGIHIDNRGKLQKTHYHWINPESKNKKVLSKKESDNIKYFDKFGNVCSRKSDQSHIKPHKTRRK